MACSRGRLTALDERALFASAGQRRAGFADNRGRDLSAGDDILFGKHAEQDFPFIGASAVMHNIDFAAEKIRIGITGAIPRVQDDVVWPSFSIVGGQKRRHVSALTGMIVFDQQQIAGWGAAVIKPAGRILKAG